MLYFDPDIVETIVILAAVPQLASTAPSAVWFSSLLSSHVPIRGRVLAITLLNVQTSHWIAAATSRQK